MTPKIRGVAPAIRRYTKPDAAVKRPHKGDKEPDHGGKRLQKGHKEPDPSADKLQKGDVVDVRLEEEGLYGSWHPAVICGVKPGLRQVKFNNLFDGKNNPVREWVRFGKEAPDAKLPAGTRKVTDNKPVLRPGGPGLPPPEPSFRKTGSWPKDLWVEVYSQEAWWEGVLVEDISATQMGEEESVVDVIFPQLDDITEQVALKNLRECKDWNEDTGLWTIRGPRTKEHDPIPESPRSPVLEGVAATDLGGGTSTGQDEESSFVNIEDTDGNNGVGATGVESLKAGAKHPLPSPGIVGIVHSKKGLNKEFGRLTEVVEREKHYLLKVQTLAYTLEQINISVKEDFLSLDATSDSVEEKLGIFSCKVHSVCSSILRLPTDVSIDRKNISWELHDKVLTVTVPISGGPGEK